MRILPSRRTPSTTSATPKVSSNSTLCTCASPPAVTGDSPGSDILTRFAALGTLSRSAGEGGPDRKGWCVRAGERY
jgi:hypothetical protein